MLAYLSGTIDCCLTLGGKSGPHQTLVGYCDSDYAGDFKTRRSTTGFCFKYRHSAISWSSVQPATVATSTCEAGYMALSEAVKEAI